MIIEFIGSTAAGKTTLANEILLYCQKQGLDVIMDSDFLLSRIGLNWIRKRLVRLLFIDMICVIAFLGTWRKNLKFFYFSCQVIMKLPVSWRQKLNLTRNIIKKIGVYEIVRSFGNNQQIILVDEGTLHAVHNLFVNVSMPANAKDLASFAMLVSLPDLAVHLKPEESILIERTLARGHKRIRDSSYAKTELFVRRALDGFENLIRHLVFEGRMLKLNSNPDILIAFDYHKNRNLTTILKILISIKKL